MFANQSGGQQQYQDFINRYQQGAPTEGYSNQEVAQQYQQVVPQLSPQQFQQAAAQSFANLSPQQRMQFAQMLQQQAQQQGLNVPMQQGAGQDPNMLAQMTTQVHQQNSGLLGGLLDGITGQGGSGGQTWQTLDPQTRDLFIRTWGNRAEQEWEKENAKAHSPLNSPVAKAALAGIAAMAMKSLVGK